MSYLFRSFTPFMDSARILRPTLLLHLHAAKILMLIISEVFHTYLNVTLPTHTCRDPNARSHVQSSALVSVSHVSYLFHMHEGVAQFYEQQVPVLSCPVQISGGGPLLPGGSKTDRAVLAVTPQVKRGLVAAWSVTQHFNVDQVRTSGARGFSPPCLFDCYAH